MKAQLNIDSKIRLHIDRFQQAVLCHFGATIEYVPFTQNNRSMRDELIKNSPIETEGYWVFAVHAFKNIVGWAKVECQHLSSASLRTKFVDLVEIFLETPFEMNERIQTLDDVERALQIQFAEAGGGTNVIPLRREITTSIPTTIPSATKSPVGFSVPLLITAQSPDDIFKMALELHELSGRYAFVHLKDIDFKDTQELLNLGSVTIYIPNVEHLTKETQQLVTTYLCSYPGIMHPQIIAGSLMTLPQLSHKGEIDSRLLGTLKSCHLNMNRPFREYRREGILELYMTSLIQRPSHLWLN